MPGTHHVTVVVPTRDRPGAAPELAAAFRQTCTARTLLALVVDQSDPNGARYAEALDQRLIEAGSATAQDWAEAVGTINYEIVTRFGPRVPREYAGAPIGAEQETW